MQLADFTAPVGDALDDNHGNGVVDLIRVVSDDRDGGYQPGSARPRGRKAVMIWRMLIRWAVAVIAVPLAVAGVRRISDALEARRGSTRTTRFLRRSADTAQTLLGRPKRRRRWPRSA